MGRRSTLSAMSSASGCGIRDRPTTESASKGMNRAPVTAGIHHSVTAWAVISQTAVDFTTPEATMKLAHRIAPSTSEVRRPSR
ncbi:hypothetical protein D3C86_1906250 [compost metagenome]